jgi:hypothetical protein
MRVRVGLRRSVVLTALVSAGFASAQIAWALTPVPVLKAAASLADPSRNDSYLAFSSNSVAHPKHWNAYATSRTTDATTKLNAAGTQGFVGGLDGNVVIYQQADGPSSDIYSFDLDTRHRAKVPGLNTTKWEWSPQVSASYYSFFRAFRSNGIWYTGIYLYNRSHARLHRIAQYNANLFTTNGSVGDSHASWTVCTRKTCSAYVYDATAKIVKKIPTNNAKPQYEPIVDETNGKVFFLRSGFGCGLHVRFYWVPIDALGAAPTKVAALPDGVDVGSMSLSLNVDSGNYDLLFARTPCSTGNADIYQLMDVSPGP